MEKSNISLYHWKIKTKSVYSYRLVCRAKVFPLKSQAQAVLRAESLFEHNIF